MAKPLVDDELWQAAEPLLPAPKPRRFRFPGRKPIDNRQALTGILFVLKTGIPLEDLPQEMGCGSGMTCWRRLQAWQEAGVWQALHGLFLAKLQAADQIDWSRQLSIVPPCGQCTGQKTGPNPIDKVKAGSKHHLMTDGRGIPLATILTGANAHDVTQRVPLVEAIPSVRGKVGHPRRRPERVQGDHGYDSEPHRQILHRLGIQPVLAKRNTPHGSGLGKYRWVVDAPCAGCISSADCGSATNVAPTFTKRSWGLPVR
jgi:transposase